jgi:hypothetical protein
MLLTYITDSHKRKLVDVVCTVTEIAYHEISHLYFGKFNQYERIIILIVATYNLDISFQFKNISISKYYEPTK